MANAILNFHFDYLTTSLRWNFLFIILLLKPFFNWTSKIRPYFDPSALTHHLIFGEGSEWQKSVRFEFQLSDLWLFDENGFSARLSIYKPHLDLYSALCKIKGQMQKYPSPPPSSSSSSLSTSSQSSGYNWSIRLFLEKGRSLGWKLSGKLDNSILLSILPIQG